VLDDGLAGAGAVATRRIEPGETVLIVDSSIVLTSEMSKQYLPPALHAALSRLPARHRPVASLGVMLLYGHDEYNCESELVQQFRLYFGALAPLSEGSCFARWTASEAREFQGAGEQVARNERIRNEDEWALLREFYGADLGSHYSSYFTLDNYIHYTCLAQQRLISFGGELASDLTFLF
jgi:hypothetical protein